MVKLKGKILFLFFLFSFIFYSELSFSADEDVKTKLEEKLKVIKRVVLQEQSMLHNENEQLKQENVRILQENAQFRQALNKLETEKTELTQQLSQKPVEKETVVYQADPAQIERIQQLEQRISELNNSLNDKAHLEEGYQKEKIGFQEKIASLEARISTLTSQKDKSQKKNLSLANAQLTQENTQLKRALEDSQQLNNRLTQQITALESESNAKPIESQEKIVYQTDPSQEVKIRELQQKIAELNGYLREKEEVLAQKDQEIQKLNKVIDYTYNQLTYIASEGH